MFSVKSFSKVPQIGIDALGTNIKVEDNENYDAILVHSTPLHDTAFPKTCKAIVRVGAGVNNIPIDKCTDLGIAVFNTPGGNSNAVKELVLSGLFTISRNVKASFEWLKEQTLDGEELMKLVEAEKKKFKGYEILGKTIGIIGLGNVGGRVARACHDLGMKVVGYDPVLPEMRKIELKEYVTLYDDVNEIYHISDYISNHMPLFPETRNFINANSIENMKDGVFILNFARGEVVDTDAVLSAIESKKVAGFATDFPTQKCINNPYVYCTPHLGASTYEADNNSNLMAAEELKDFLLNGNVRNSINFPCLSSPRAMGTRICIFHKNVVGMLGKITDLIANDGHNIENLSNKARNEYAYTILDFDKKLTDEKLLNDLRNIDNVIKVTLYE